MEIPNDIPTLKVGDYEIPSLKVREFTFFGSWDSPERFWGFIRHGPAA